MNNKMNLQIRDVHNDEYTAMQDVTLSAYKEYAEVMPEAFFQVYRRQLLVTLDEEGPVERIGAWREGKIVGSVLLYPALANAYGGARASVGWPEVRLLAVAPGARGQGIGAALMEECERRARRAGAKVLGLHTIDMMQAAVRLYEQKGFIRAPELDFSPASGVLVKGYYRNLYDETSI